MRKPVSQSLFQDRAEAGRLLVKRLRELQLAHPVIYALSRGGVPVAVEIAKALKAPVDLILVRTISTQSQPEPEVRAIVDGEREKVLFDDSQFESVNDADDISDLARGPEPAEIERWGALYFGARPHIDPCAHSAILVEDGLDTVASTRAAMYALRRRGVAEIVVVAPVLSIEVLSVLRAEADRVVCLHAPRPFFTVGAFYDDFPKLTDEDTAEMLRSIWAEEPACHRSS